MSTARVFAVLLVLLAGMESADAQSDVRLQRAGVFHVAQLSQQMAQQSGQDLIPQSMALRVALRYFPGSQGLDVALMDGGRPVYAVKLKTGNRVHRVLVDARTGQIVGN